MFVELHFIKQKPIACVPENGSSDSSNSVFNFDLHVAFGIITISTVKPMEAWETHTASKNTVMDIFCRCHLTLLASVHWGNMKMSPKLITESFFYMLSNTN